MDVLKGFKKSSATVSSLVSSNASEQAAKTLASNDHNDQDDDIMIENEIKDISKLTTEEDGFEYVVGAVARKFRVKYPYVGDFTYKLRENFVHLSTYSLLDHDYAYPSSYVDHLSLGGLTKPSNELMEQAKAFESFFKSYHKDSISKEKGVVAKVSGALGLKYPDIPSDIIEHFIRLRTHIRISTLNRKIKEAKAAKLSVKRTQKPADKPARPAQKKMRKILL